MHVVEAAGEDPERGDDVAGDSVEVVVDVGDQPARPDLGVGPFVDPDDRVPPVIGADRIAATARDRERREEAVDRVPGRAELRFLPRAFGASRLGQRFVPATERVQRQRPASVVAPRTNDAAWPETSPARARSADSSGLVELAEHDLGPGLDDPRVGTLGRSRPDPRTRAAPRPAPRTRAISSRPSSTAPAASNAALIRSGWPMRRAVASARSAHAAPTSSSAGSLKLLSICRNASASCPWSVATSDSAAAGVVRSRA